MSWKPSDRFIQVSLGVALLAVSGFFLWKDTIRPIARKFGGARTSTLEADTAAQRSREIQRRNEAIARDEEERALLERHRREKAKLQQELREQERREEGKKFDSPQPASGPASAPPP